MENNSDNAYTYIKKNYTNKEIKQILSGDKDLEKIAVLLNLKTIDEDKTAKLIIKNLVNQSGPVREASAYILSNLIKVYKSFFQDKDTLNTINLALNDVNPNVVRFMLETIKYIDNKEYIFDKLIINIQKIYKDIANKPRRGKTQEHIFTKKCFKIYWSLESIKKIIYEKSDIIYDVNTRKESFFNLLKLLYSIDEYTIREKIAQIISMLPKEEVKNLGIELEKDKNYFVRRYGKGN